MLHCFAPNAAKLANEPVGAISGDLTVFALAGRNDYISHPLQVLRIPPPPLPVWSLRGCPFLPPRSRRRSRLAVGCAGERRDPAGPDDRPEMALPRRVAD